VRIDPAEPIGEDPATQEAGAIEALIGEGRSINVTLSFSIMLPRGHRGLPVGLEQLLRNGGDVSKVASVASFFVSRVDTR